MGEIYVGDLTTLVFSSGGAQACPLFAGALSRLVSSLPDLDYTHRKSKICRARGCSAGSIMALLVCLRLSPTDISAIIMRQDDSVLRECSLSNLTEAFGLNRGYGIEADLHTIIRDATGLDNPTFSALRQTTGMCLEVVTTNVNTKSVNIFSPEHTPDTLILDTILGSIAIPIFFAPRVIGGEFHVDGGVIAKYPQSGLGYEALGFNVVNEDRTTHESPFLDYFSKFVRLLTSFGESRALTIPTVQLECPDGSLMAMRMSTLDRANYISLGHVLMSQWMESQTIVGRQRDAWTQTLPLA
jgi:hypothetical protein